MGGTVEKAPYLKQDKNRTGLWSLRLPIPPALQSAYGRKSGRIDQSLKTRNFAEAQRIAAPLIKRYQDEFKALAGLSAEQQAHLLAQGGTLDAMREAHAQSAARVDMLTRIASYRPTPADLDTPGAMDVMRLQAVIADALPVFKEWTAIQAGIVDAPADRDAADLDVMTVCRRYLDDTSGKRNAKVRGKIESRVKAFTDWARVTLGECPTFADWKALRAAAVAYLNHRLNSGREVSVVRLEAGDLTWIGAYALANDLIMRDPFAGLKDNLPKVTGKKDSTFDPAEAHAMLTTARATWGADHWQALHTLAATGLRANEALQLRPCDIRQVTAADRRMHQGCGAMGAWILDVNDQPDTHPATKGWPARHLKETAHTTRLAPIHKDLLPILLDAKERNALAPRLFNTACRPDSDNAADTLGAKVRALITACGIVAGSREIMPCHGWRHTLSHLAEVAHGKLYALSLLGKACGEYGRPIAAGELKAGLDCLEVFGTP